MSPFTQKVVIAVKSIPAGNVASYGQIALMVGVPRAARQVGWILHQYSDETGTPWWRVINNAGRISTTCLDHTALDQKAHLEKEGIKVTKKLNVAIEKYRYRPKAADLKNIKLTDEYIYRVLEKYDL